MFNPRVAFSTLLDLRSSLARVANQFSPKKARLLTKNRLSYKKARKKARRSHEKSQKKLDLPNHKKADLVTGKANKTNLVTEKNLNADLITGKAN